MIELTPFHSPIHSRDGIKQPWTRDGRTYATCGCVILSVGERADIPDHPKAPNVELAVLYKLRGEARVAAGVPLPELPEPETRACCMCPKGREPYAGCEECGGTGVEVLEVPVPIGKRRFDSGLLRKIATLPGLVIFPEGAPGTPMYFVFDEGEGGIMPLRAEAEKPAPVADNAPQALTGADLQTVAKGVAYLLKRLGEDRELYHHCGLGSESFAQITQAGALLRGVPVEQVREEIFAAIVGNNRK